MHKVIASLANASPTLGPTNRGLFGTTTPERNLMSNTTVETHPNVLSTTALIGDNVVNRAGENLGKIEELMLDLEKGRVAYAVLSFGGVLGIGEKLFVVPFEALKLDGSREHFMLDVDKDRLKNAPSFDKNNLPKASDRTWGAEVYKFYGYKPYWQ
jgi:sporulation protein YlmC with PRC-barrel domain